MEANHIIIALSAIIIASYLFSVLSKRSGIPSVLLLLGVGIALRYTMPFTGIDLGTLNEFVKLFGNAGLIMIVLEASLDLHLKREKLPLITRAFLSAFSILVTSALGVAAAIHFILNVSFFSALIYAAPLSIISSAIAIPSAEHLPESKREFVTYESAFSDIIGILLFYYLLSEDVFSASSVITWGFSFTAMAISSLALSFFLLYLASKLTTQVKIFLLLAILFLVYAIGKEFHLPSLTLIMMFGLILNNFTLFIHPKTSSFITTEILKPILTQFKSITAEVSFLLRTFFFVLFGFTITLASLLDATIISLGLTIVGILLLVRFFYFKFFLNTGLFPEIFLMPRGLITILLFYSIPETQSIAYFDKGILFFLILATGLLMTFGLIMYKTKNQVDGEFINSSNC